MQNINAHFQEKLKHNTEAGNENVNLENYDRESQEIKKSQKLQVLIYC